MKTEEELRSLKNEYSEISAALSELSEDELNLVVGGSGGEAERKIGGYYFSDHVPADNAVLNADYYITVDGKDSWYRGTIIEIEKVSYWIFFTQKHYVVRLSDCNGWGASGVMDFYSSDVTLYKTMVRHWY